MGRSASNRPSGDPILLQRRHRGNTSRNGIWNYTKASRRIFPMLFKFQDSKSCRIRPSSSGSYAEITANPMSRHSVRDVFVSKDLQTTSHVFVRQDLVRRPLTQPYEGPFKVIKRCPKFYKLQMKGCVKNVSINRLKPAFFLSDDLPKGPTLQPEKQPSPPSSLT